jgi:predicted chitinase
VPLTIDDINKLQFGILDAIASTNDEARKGQLRRELEYYQTQKAKIISEKSAARVAILAPRVAALERIVRELQNPALLAPIDIFRQKAGLTDSQGAPAAPTPTETTAENDVGEEEVLDGTSDDDGAAPVIVRDDPVEAQPPPAEQGGDLKLAEAHMIALWRRSQFPIQRGKIVVFGIRGSLPVDYAGTDFADTHELTRAQVNFRTMNCTIGQWIPSKGLAVFPGSTVPYGPSVEKYIAAKGVGINQMGRGRYSKYVPNWHKRSDGPNGHWALVQECAITLQRTGDDSDFDLLDRWEVGKIAGDNIHCAFFMGPGGNIPSSRYSSYGCQVVAGTVKKGVPDSEAGPWKKFITSFKGNDAPRQIEYVLFDSSEVLQMVKTQCRGKSIILRFGSQGPLVAELQRRLSDFLARPIKVDSSFGPLTFQAVLDFQTRVFGDNADDGIIGALSAEKLGMELPLFDFDDAIAGGTGFASGRDEIALAASRNLLTKEFFAGFAKRPSSSTRKAIYDKYIDFLTSNDCARLLQKYGIDRNNERLSHFLAQATHETGGFALMRESLTYTTVNAIRRAWKSRASKHSDEWIKANLLRNPVALGDWAYGGRMGNRKGTSDGFDFRGGGTFQTTGRSAYRRMGLLAVVDLETHPELIEDPRVSVLAACAEWDALKANSLADRGEIKKISRGINIGNPNSTTPANGEEDRIALQRKIAQILAG